MIIPTLRVKAMWESVAFYTEVLDFELEGTWPEAGDPSFSVLRRRGDELHLSSHGGDGTFGQAVVVLTEDVEGLWAFYRGSGLDISGKSGSPVHQGPTDQSWGTREFYVDDPNGHTIRFVQR